MPLASVFQREDYVLNNIGFQEVDLASLKPDFAPDILSQLRIATALHHQNNPLLQTVLFEYFFAQ